MAHCTAALHSAWHGAWHTALLLCIVRGAWQRGRHRVRERASRGAWPRCSMYPPYIHQVFHIPSTYSPGVPYTLHIFTRWCMAAPCVPYTLHILTRCRSLRPARSTTPKTSSVSRPTSRCRASSRRKPWPARWETCTPSGRPSAPRTPTPG